MDDVKNYIIQCERCSRSKAPYFVLSWKHVFSKDSQDLGKTDVLKHRIDLVDDVPIKEKARRIAPNIIDELREHIQMLLRMGVIEESVSPWSSPIVLVRKKSGELRMCVDYRKLNSKTVKDASALGFQMRCAASSLHLGVTVALSATAMFDE